MEALVHQVILDQRKILQKLNNLEKLHAQMKMSQSVPTISSSNLQSNLQQVARGIDESLLDDLNLINDAFTNTTKRYSYSNYHANFMNLQCATQVYKYQVVHPSKPIRNDTLCLLPYFILDFVDLTKEGITVSINQNVWTDHIQLYYITEDSTIRKVTHVQASIENETCVINCIEESLSMNVNEFDIFLKKNGGSSFAVAVDNKSLHFDHTLGVLHGLITRALLFLFGRDLILELKKNIEIESSLTRIEKSIVLQGQSTIGIGGIRILKQKLSCGNVHEIIFAENEQVDAYPMYTFLFQVMPRFQSTIDPSYVRLGRQISEMREKNKFYINVQIYNGMSSDEVKIETIGYLPTILNLRDVKSLRRSSIGNPFRGQTFEDFIYTPNEDMYLSKVPLVEFRNKAGKVQKISVGSVVYVNKAWKLPEIELDTITEVCFLSDVCSCPERSISTYMDLLMFYPRMLPYSTDEKNTVKVSYTFKDVTYGNVTYADRSIDFGNTELDLAKEIIENAKGMKTPVLRGRVSSNRLITSVMACKYVTFQVENLVVKNREITIRELSHITPIAPGIEMWRLYSSTGLPLSNLTSAKLDLSILDEAVVSILQVPHGFVTWTQEYDMQFRETYEFLTMLYRRSSFTLHELVEMKEDLKNVSKLVMQLVDSVNKLGEAFTKLTHELEEKMNVPMWKKILQGAIMLGGLVAMIVMPFCFPIGIAILAGTTALQVGLSFSEGDFLAGGVQIAGVLIGLGTGYYVTRKAQTASYKVTEFNKAGLIEPVYPKDFDTNLLANDGLWIEVKPLKMLGPTVEGIGGNLIQNHRGVLRSLVKMETAPVHARVRAATTSVVDNQVIRDTIISGVTDGMPYLSHVNPRPGTIALKETFSNGRFINGWTEKNVPIGGTFHDLDRSIQGLLLEGSKSDGVFKSLMTRWEHFEGSDRAMALNDAQDMVNMNASAYNVVSNSRVPISFDPTLMRNVSNVFAKHTGMYELTGLTGPGGVNNCQTYANELRDFMANGRLRQNKLDSVPFLNDLMDAFDTSVQFSHVYGPGLKKSVG